MDLTSILNIRKYRDSIRGRIKTIPKSTLNSTSTYGGENEYKYKGLIGGLESLMTDISTLTKATNKFIAISTHTERSTIVQHLARIDEYFDSPPNYIAQFEALKVLLRSYNVRSWSERQLEFETELSNTLKIKLELQEELEEIKTIKKSINTKNDEIEAIYDSKNEKLDEIENALISIIEKKDDLIAQSETLQSINRSVEAIKENAAEHLSDIESSLTESKSNEKLITSFANNVQERDKRLTELGQATEENKTKLLKYEEERQSILKEAENLISSAKKALNYKTAEGISASFQEQYNNSNNRWIYGSWILGALLCLCAAIGLGLWVLNTAPDQIGLLIGRISLLPLPIIGAVFCANQYSKQKNIIEDYAYKMVLSKAIVGFSEQLKKHGSGENQEYVHYIKTSLEEIHKDPLRKRYSQSMKQDNSSNFKNLIELAEKIAKFSKTE